MSYRYKTETLNVVWINVEDKLPEEGNLTYIQLKNNQVKEGYCITHKEKTYFYTADFNYKLSEVNYWCYPLKLKGVK